jgi:hypothetical protein
MNIKIILPVAKNNWNRCRKSIAVHFSELIKENIN